MVIYEEAISIDIFLAISIYSYLQAYLIKGN